MNLWNFKILLSSRDGGFNLPAGILLMLDGWKAGWMEGRMDGWMYGRPMGIIRLLSSTVLLCRLNKKCRSTGGGDAGGL